MKMAYCEWYVAKGECKEIVYKSLQLYYIDQGKLLVFLLLNKRKFLTKDYFYPLTNYIKRQQSTWIMIFYHQRFFAAISVSCFFLLLFLSIFLFSPIIYLINWHESLTWLNLEQLILLLPSPKKNLDSIVFDIKQKLAYSFPRANIYSRP